IDGYLPFFHSLQQSRLCLWGCAVNFVSKNYLRHNWARAELEIAGLLIVDRDTCNITGQKVRRKLDPLKGASNRASNGLGKHRLSYARQIFDQPVPTANNGN